MTGITSYGAYIPLQRLERTEISKAWHNLGIQGEKAVANYDEDSVTMTENGLSSKEIAKAVLYSPAPRSHQTLARLLGFDPKSQVQDSLRLTVVVISDLIRIPCFVASREGDVGVKAL